MDYCKAFADNLRELLAERGLTVCKFAREVGIPQPTITRYLLCQRKITVQNLCKIADFFHEDIDFLLGRKSY